MSRKHVAIIGSGCAGLGAFWALKGTPHDVDLYEADGRLGGHTNTLPFDSGKGTIMVDTGFIVLNRATYRAFEWAGTSLGGVFAQTKNIFDPSHWRMVFDIIRFNLFALQLLSDSEEDKNLSAKASFNASSQDAKKLEEQESIGSYLAREGYSDSFKNNYLIPMTAAIWSTGPNKTALDFPAITLVRFMWNHHLLSTLASRPEWMTVSGGSKQYIDKIMDGVPENKIHLNTPVQSISDEQSAGKITVTLSNGQRHRYDHVIIATHGDQALRLLSSPTEQEKSILSNFHTGPNTAYLHSDMDFMPRNPIAWSAWNYLTTSKIAAPGSQPSGKEKSDKQDTSEIDKVSLTFDMNILQHYDREKFGPVLVTLNPDIPPAASKIQKRIEYRHPLYTPQAINAQARLPEIQNVHGISFCGAWTKYGFHEDGFSSGLSVAMEHLGAELPFKYVDATFSRGRKPQITTKDKIGRFIVSILQVVIVFFDKAMILLAGLGLFWLLGGIKSKSKKD